MSGRNSAEAEGPYCNYGKPGTRWEEVAWQRLSQHDLYPEKVDNR